MSARILGAIALLALTTACASTGAVPKPFPTPTAKPPSTSVPPPSPVRPTPDPDLAPAPAPGGESGVDTYALVGAALSLRGAPYRNGGSDPKGFDCSGFTQYVYAQFGVALPREVREQFRVGKSVNPAELAPGDLVFFTTTDPGVSHVAIAIGGDEFVHAPSSTGVVRVEHLSSSYWAPRYLGARRVN